MHPNKVFREAQREQNIAFARKTGFGMLCLTAEGTPLVSHLPFLLSENGALAEFHLVRSNPIARALRKGPGRVTLAVQGPHSYISPDWYGIEDQVPTWNYVAVHLNGLAELSAEQELLDLLDRQSASYEARLEPKPAWTTKKMSPGVMDRMMRQILPCKMRVDAIDGTWKFSQNKTNEARLAAANHVDQSGIGSEVQLLAAIMKSDPSIS